MNICKNTPQSSLTFRKEMKPAQICLVVFFCLRAVLADDIEDEWSFFKSKFGKFYKTEEEDARRLKIFKENYGFIHRHNVDYQKSFKVEVNFFADLEREDFKASDEG